MNLVSPLLLEAWSKEISVSLRMQLQETRTQVHFTKARGELSQHAWPIGVEAVSFYHTVGI